MGKGRFRFIGFPRKIRGGTASLIRAAAFSLGVMAAPDHALRLLGGEEPIMLDIVIKGGEKGMAIYDKTLHQYRRHTVHDYKLPDGRLYHKGGKYLRRKISALSIKGPCL